MTVPEDCVPDACTLPTPERPLRVAEFDELFTRVLRSERVQPTRLQLLLPADLLPAARDLARRESQCCSFFTFEFHSAEEEVLMRIEVPAAHVDVLDAFEARAAAR
ncbi:hypothetical protein [Mycolicibacterium tusciae]|uniref:hypothetical protein n=1 Tax=Mycolicibacterium tusciae TaxID=75922 RepID=UPI00024A36F0|nr:hypothetical protein [Mycolicibacterium tusciae]